MKKAILVLIMVLSTSMAFAEAESDHSKQSKNGINVCEDLRITANLNEEAIGKIMEELDFKEVKDRAEIKKIEAYYKVIERNDEGISSTDYFFNEGSAIIAYVQYKQYGVPYIFGCSSLHDRRVLAK